VRDHNTVRAKLKRPHDAGIPVLANSNHEINSSRTAGQRQAIDHIEIVRAMFHIEPHHVEAELPHNLGKPGLRHAIDAYNLDEFSRSQFRSHSALDQDLPRVLPRLVDTRAMALFGDSPDNTQVASIKSNMRHLSVLRDQEKHCFLRLP
jgi:hypothetical protein